MSELAASSPEPGYVVRLALNGLPFGAVSAPEAYYQGPEIEQRLNLLLHMLRASGKIGLVRAPDGSGKTELLNQLQLRTGDDMRMCRIHGAGSLSFSTFLTLCMHAFVGTDDIGNETGVISHLQQRLGQLARLNIRPVVLLDDFHLITPEVREQINDCLLWKSDDNYLLQAVLTVTDGVSTVKALQSRIQAIDLPALKETEVAAYLLQRLQAVGYQDALPFNDKALKSFYTQSGGVPAKLNQLAHQQLLGGSFQPLVSAATSSKPKVSFKKIMRWTGLLLLATLFGALLLFQDELNKLFIAKPAIETESVTGRSLPQGDEIATVVVDKQPVTSANKAQREELLNLVAELSETADAQGDDAAPPVENTTVVIQQQPTSTADNGSEQSATITQTKAHQQDWILQQRGTDYTFQLMGSWDHHELVEFIDKYALSGDVAEFQSMRNGQVWYALIYGVYPGKQAALDASKKWPAPLNTLPSWLRRFDSVQNQIKNKVITP